MKLMTTLPQSDLRAVPQAARTAEQAGYDYLATMENRHEPFLPLAVAAVNSERVTLTTAVAIAFARSPMVVANAAWDLQVASGGRFVLGIGPQIRAHNEKRFSVRWSPPVPRMREYVRALRAIWRAWELGEKLAFEGDHYTFTLMIPNFVPESTGQSSVPVTAAAVGPRSLRLAGEAFDGVRLHPFCTRAYLEEACLARIGEGLASSGRRREHFEVCGGGFLATGPDDETVDRMAEWVRYRVAFYGSTPSYWPVLEHHDLGDLGRKLNRMTKQGQWGRIAAEVPDDVVRLFAAVGRYDELVPAIETRLGGAADVIYASTSSEMRPELPRELIQDIQRIPVPFRSFQSAW